MKTISAAHEHHREYARGDNKVDGVFDPALNRIVTVLGRTPSAGKGHILSGIVVDVRPLWTACPAPGTFLKANF